MWLALPSIAQDETTIPAEVSFEVTGTEEYDRNISEASWIIEISKTLNVRIGATFDLTILEAPDRNSIGVRVNLNNIPTAIEAGEYEFTFGGVDDYRRGDVIIGGAVTFNSGSGVSFSSARSDSTFVIDSVEDGLLSGSFTFLDYEEGTLTGQFTNLPIPTQEGCYIETDLDMEMADEDAPPQVSFITQTTLEDSETEINVEVERGFYATSMTNGTLVFRETVNGFSLSLSSLPNEEGAFSDSVIIRIRNIPYTDLEAGDIEVDGRITLATIEYLPGLEMTNRDLEGIITIDEVSDTISGSFTLDIIADDFSDGAEGVLGTVSGTFNAIPLPLPRADCRIQSWATEE